MQVFIKSLLICFSFFSVVMVSAQSYTISGYIKDSTSSEALPGANIFEKISLKGTASNAYGFFSITLPAGNHLLRFSYTGYSTKFEEISLSGNMNITILLKPAITLQQVDITASGSELLEQSARMSSISLPVQQMKSLPAFMGETDILKSLQLLPGVQSGTEGSSALYVRGGGPDQNLILLDDAPVYNAGHLLGFFSIFNADAIKNVELIKGGFPARYGGRLSSVVDIRMKEGNMKKLNVEGSLGLISSKLMVEGPILKEKTSFIITGRRTYIDYLAQPIVRGVTTEYNKNGLFFYDLNAKVNHVISAKDRLYLSVYSGKDEYYNDVLPSEYLYDGVIYKEQSKSSLSWGNLTSSAKWNHQINEKTFGNLAFTYSNYNFTVKDFQESIVVTDTSTSSKMYSIRYLSGIRDFALKADIDYMPSPSHFIKFGMLSTFHTFQPGVNTISIEESTTNISDSTSGSKAIEALETGLYFEDDYQLNERIKANFGLHYSSFLVEKKYYHSLQPRASVRYLLPGDWIAKGSYASMQQNIHLLTNSSIGLPTDLWVPSTAAIKPQKSKQFAAGISRTFRRNYLVSLEGYYKWMNQIIEYTEGASYLNSNANWEEKVTVGKGNSYGMEILLQKKEGNTKGWIGYTLSWSNRTFPEINYGETFPYKFDRRHDISIVLMQKIDDKWDFSAEWVYGTGNAVTLATIKFPGPDGWEIQTFDKRNSYRAADYHRLDVSFTRTKETRWGTSSWNLGMYNVYNRKNPFYYYFGVDSRGSKALKRVSLFQMIPSVSYTFRFSIPKNK
ncbi:MAG: TonB-dependent receptor [Bacteroidales bacterium]|nr:TonB-dependent receptor [Bacteroidales bacterium]